jgi:nucleotide-binding universal stress UspA family protein
MYKNILIPLENSATDFIILAHVKPLARLLASKLILVHVADGFGARNQEQLNLEDSEEIRSDRDYLEQRRLELAGEGFAVESRLVCGDPADQILNMAKEERCDLIAMGTHGHRFIKDVLLGSVANSVRHRTDVPVLLVRAPER